MSSTQPQVLVVGSGPSGLLLALSLLKNGISVRIIEKDPEHHVGERGPGVMPRTLEIEHFLGVEDDVKSAGDDWLPLRFYDEKDPYRVAKTVQMMEMIESTPSFPIGQGVSLGQWIHQKILRKHIQSLGCEVELGCALTSIEQREDDVVAHLARTVDGELREETASFSYIIGADGAHSVVRKQLDVKLVGETRGEKLYIVDAVVEGIMKGPKAFNVWGDSTKSSVVIRNTNRDDVFQMIIAGPEVQFDALKAKQSVEAVQAEVERITARSDLKIKNITWQGEWRPNMRIADHFRDRRVFIVGDAAHVHSPTGGQGLNSSMQDSFNLAWKLALSLKGHASSILLDSFEVERIPVIAEMLNITTDLFNKTFRLENGQALSTKESEEAGWKRDRKLFQLDINYRWSSIVLDERFNNDGSEVQNAYGVEGQDLRAGDRAPDAPGLAQIGAKLNDHVLTRLFDVFDPTCHTALIFASDPSDADTRALVDSHSKLPSGLVRTVFILPPHLSTANIGPFNTDLSFVDTEGHAYRGYGLEARAERPAAFIVRPDAMVGAFASNPLIIESYFSKVFGPA